MYKGAQRKHDFIQRTGSSSTRYHARAYVSEISELELFPISAIDVDRMRLNELLDERAVLIKKLGRCEDIIKACRLAGEPELSKRIHPQKMAIGVRIGLLNRAIKSENIRIADVGQATKYKEAILAVLGKVALEQVHEYLRDERARRIEEFKSER